jgi:hypothetical protein
VSRCGRARLCLAVPQPSSALSFGYSASMRRRRSCSCTAAHDTVSILVMEIVDNAIMVGVPGAMDAGLTSWLFWGALAFALAVAFVLTVPVNKWMIGRGRGHAVVHAYHH